MSHVPANISVIVRTMGRPSLGAALASVDLQGRSDVCIVLVNASGAAVPTPATRCAVHAVGEGAPLHRTRAANVGLAAVQTRWAMFLDDDDVLLAGHLDKLMAALAANPSAVLAHTGVALLRSEGEDGAIDAAFEPWEILLGNRMPIHAALFDASFAQANAVQFDESLDVYEDWDFWLQLQCLGRFTHVPGVSAHYLIGPESSAVHQWQHGAPAYWRIWHKWWGKAPKAWWAQAFKAGVELPGTRAHLSDVKLQLQDALARWHVDAQNLVQTQADLAAQCAETAATQTALQNTQTERDVLAASLAATRIEQARLRDEHAQLLQSSSWRLTQPLRQVADLLRQWRARAGALRRNAPWRRWATWGGADKAYQTWQRDVEAPDMAKRKTQLAARCEKNDLLISIVMPVYNPELKHLDAAIASAQAQTWPHWQLCIADDASTAPGVREHLRSWAAREPRISLVERAQNGHISAASNSALALAQGQWVAMLDQDDMFASTALAEVVDAIDAFQGCGLVYSDEDKLDARGQRFEAHFKPAFQMDLLHGHNFINHLAAYRRDLLMAVGAWRPGYEGAQDHDMNLRLARRLSAAQIVHIPRVLYHWRTGPNSTASSGAAKPLARNAALRAVLESAQQEDASVQVEWLQGADVMRVRYPVPAVSPQIVYRPMGDVTSVAANSYVLAHGDQFLLPDAAAMAELVSLLSRHSVGVVGASLRGSGGQLVHGGYECDEHGQWQAVSLHSRVGSRGQFGRHSMVQDVAAVSSLCMLMRADLWPLWVQALAAHGADQVAADVYFGHAVRRAGLRVLWSPHAGVTHRQT